MPSDCASTIPVSKATAHVAAHTSCNSYSLRSKIQAIIGGHNNMGGVSHIKEILTEADMPYIHNDITHTCTWEEHWF